MEHDAHYKEAIQKDSTTFFGFWMYLMTDIVLFASLFATFAVLRNGAFGGMTIGHIFSAPFVLTETVILLCSSFAAGGALIAAQEGRRVAVLVRLAIAGLLGVAFLTLEISEFAKLAAEGHGWWTSGAMSAYYALVATHGLHIAVGLLWVIALIISIAHRGLSRSNMRKLLLWSSFWHFLDLVWIFIFTIVYLFGL